MPTYLESGFKPHRYLKKVRIYQPIQWFTAMCSQRPTSHLYKSFFFAIIIMNFDNFTLELNSLRPTAGELNQIFPKIKESHIFNNSADNIFMIYF